MILRVGSRYWLLCFQVLLLGALFAGSGLSPLYVVLYAVGPSLGSRCPCGGTRDMLIIKLLRVPFLVGLSPTNCIFLNVTFLLPFACGISQIALHVDLGILQHHNPLASPSREEIIKTLDKGASAALRWCGVSCRWIGCVVSAIELLSEWGRRRTEGPSPSVVFSL